MMSAPIGKVERIKTLRTASMALRGATQRWADKYADKKHYDKQGFGFTISDRPAAFTVPKLSFEAYVGTYGNSSVGTAWRVDQGVITQYFAQALNIHKQLIFDTIAKLADEESQKLVGEAQAELDALTAMLADVTASVGTHPEGQDGEAGLVRSMGDAVPKADAQTPSPITPNGA